MNLYGAQDLIPSPNQLCISCQKQQNTTSVVFSAFPMCHTHNNADCVKTNKATTHLTALLKKQSFQVQVAR